MKVVRPDNTSHTIAIIPRYYGFGETELILTNLPEDKSETIVHSINVVAGFVEITFDYIFSEREKYSILFREGKEVVYRGLLFATEQETQDFDIVKNYYSYE